MRSFLTLIAVVICGVVIFGAVRLNSGVDSGGTGKVIPKPVVKPPMWAHEHAGVHYAKDRVAMMAQLMRQTYGTGDAGFEKWAISDTSAEKVRRHSTKELWVALRLKAVAGINPAAVAQNLASAYRVFSPSTATARIVVFGDNHKLAEAEVAPPMRGPLTPKH